MKNVVYLHHATLPRGASRRDALGLWKRRMNNRVQQWKHEAVQFVTTYWNYLYE
ncbi:MAG: hypothetical protein ACRC5C_07190 [Bacilli bacterium]